MDNSIENYAEQNENALKNNLIDMYINVLTTKEHANELKISIDNATENVKAVLKDIERNRKTQQLSTFDIYSPSYQEERKQEYTGGKAGIGPMALNNAHHILTQLLNPKFELDPITVALDLVDTNKIYDDPTAGVQKGGRVLDWLSAMINGFVDIAKDPYIIRLNVNPWTYNMVTYLLRMGKGQQTFYFIGQPILKDMAEAVAKTKGKYGIDQTKTASQLEKEAIKSILDMYDSSGSILKLYNSLSVVQIADMLKDLFRTDIINGKPTSRLRELLINDPQDIQNYNKQQILVYFAFKTLSEYSNNLADLVKYSKVDTKKMGKSFIEQRDFLNGMNNLKSDPQVRFKKGEVSRFYNESFLTTKTRNSVELAASVFKGELYRTSDAFIKQQDGILDQIGRKKYAGAKLLSALTKSMEAGIKSDYFNALLQRRGITAHSMMYGNKTIAKRLLAFKQLIYQGRYPDLLNANGDINNDFLEYLLPNINSSADKSIPDFVDTASLLSEDVIQADNMINYWNDLLEHDKPEIRRLAEDLILYAFITSGDNSNANSFFNYVPNRWRISSGYVDYTNTELEYLQSGSSTRTSSDDIFLNSWYDKQIVKPYLETVPFDTKEQEFDELGRPVQATTGFITFDAHSKLLDRKIPKLIIGKRSNRSASNEDIKPIGFVEVKEDDKLISVPKYPPYINIRFGNVNLLAETVMYKLVGITSEQQADSNKVNHSPVYTIVEKKGMKYRGHVITEYGRSGELPFNKIGVSYNGESAMQSKQVLVDIFSDTTLDDNFKMTMLEILSNIKTPNQFYQNVQYRSYDQYDIETDTYNGTSQFNDIEADLPSAPTQSTETIENGGLNFGDVVEQPTAEETSEFTIPEGMKQVKLKLTDSNISFRDATSILNGLQQAYAIPESESNKLIDTDTIVEDWVDLESVVRFLESNKQSEHLINDALNWLEVNRNVSAWDYTSFADIVSDYIYESGALVPIEQSGSLFTEQEMSQFNDENEFPSDIKNKCKGK